MRRSNQLSYAATVGRGGYGRGLRASPFRSPPGAVRIGRVDGGVVDVVEEVPVGEVQVPAAVGHHVAGHLDLPLALGLSRGRMALPAGSHWAAGDSKHIRCTAERVITTRTSASSRRRRLTSSAAL